MRDFHRSTVVEKITVPVTALVTLFQGRKLEKQILVKIDVLGFEGRVIRGSKDFSKLTEWVQMRVSFANLYEGERDLKAC